MSPDPRFLFFTPSHREALAGLMYGILNRKGFVSLIGDAGTGKTSLLRRVLDAVTGNKSLIVSPSVAASEFTKLVMSNFGIEGIPASKADQLVHFEKFLSQSQQEGKLCVLVVDEAQRLSPEVLEEIRMLTNFELPDGKLLQIVLAGQSELRDMLNRPDLWQLKQRIAMRLTLKPLSGVDEVGVYIRHRWMTAGGGDAPPFSAEAIALVARCSTGIPRIVNVLCDNALLLAFAEGSHLVAVEQVRSAATELDLLDPAKEVKEVREVNEVREVKEVNGVNEIARNGFPPSNGFHVEGGVAVSEEATATVGTRPVAMCPKLERFQPARTRRSRFWGWFAK
jgi:general secretion pathway protein A